MTEISSADFDRVLRERRTTKVMSAEALPAESRLQGWQNWLDVAAWAPFHRPAHAVHTQATALTGIVPWRFYVLEADCCRQLRDRLADRECGKIRDMLATAELLIQATWLPNPPCAPLPSGSLFEATLENMEHLAAAGAAIQNVLLSATARGIPNYWSSGGILREADVFDWLGISDQEILLGSLFLFPSTADPSLQIVHSKLRDQRTPLATWLRTVRFCAPPEAEHFA